MKYLKMGGLLLVVALAGTTAASAHEPTTGNVRCGKTCSATYRACIKSCVGRGSQPTCTVPCAQTRKGCLATGEWQTASRLCTGLRKR